MAQHFLKYEAATEASPSSSFSSSSPTSSYSATELPPPSDEQSAVIDAVLAGHCVTIPSVAGSGKTTCMLQIASRLPSHCRAVIITYNRSLKDECCARINSCGLSGRVRCYTIHGIVSRVSRRLCNDDSKLQDVLRMWDRGEMGIEEIAPVPMDLVMLDEAQDLRPSLYAAICHVIRFCHRRCGFEASEAHMALLRAGVASETERFDDPTSIQICLVGDPKQMLYDFPTFGSDRASTQYMDDPEKHWGQFTGGRAWVRRKLSVSYRLTPNIAAFVNAVWGTSIQGGNDRCKNQPVEYICKNPFPPKQMNTDPLFLDTKYLQSIIDTYGAENVMFLASSIKSEKCPIRVHVNELMQVKDSGGGRKYNFHIKESLRGFEGRADVKNKVRVWTFCGSKGCEADAVVIFGFDGGWLAPLNQMGVALSRAKKRLVVIHGKSFEHSESIANSYYPLLSDSEQGLHYSVYFGGHRVEVNVPFCKDKDGDIIRKRSELAAFVFRKMESAGVIRTLDDLLPDEQQTKYQGQQEREEIYAACGFCYFSSVEQERFLAYANWTQESGVVDRIQYNINVRFERTTEDVSALYGEALMYMLQWERDGYCPKVETVVNDGILQFGLSKWYREDDLMNILFVDKKCEPLPPKSLTLFRNALKVDERGGKGVMGKDLIRLINTRISINKKRLNGKREIIFRVKALDEKKGGGDIKMGRFQSQIRSLYQAASKTAAQWMFIANAVMAHDQFHDKWNQVGTEVACYERWVESGALQKGLSRLKQLMQDVPLSLDVQSRKESGKGEQRSSFEYELIHEFSPSDRICIPPNKTIVVGVQGYCDWVGEGMTSPKGTALDLLEIKFISELSHENRLQVLVYCALRSVKTGKACTGMLYNARTGEAETCRIEASTAENFLLDISTFKYNGTKRGEKEELSRPKRIERMGADLQKQSACSISDTVQDSWLSFDGDEDDFEDALARIDLDRVRIRGSPSYPENRFSKKQKHCSSTRQQGLSQRIPTIDLTTEPCDEY